MQTSGVKKHKLDRKERILGLSEPEGVIPTPAVLTDRPEHEVTKVPQPKQEFPQSFHNILKSRRQ